MAKTLWSRFGAASRRAAVLSIGGSGLLTAGCGGGGIAGEWEFEATDATYSATLALEDDGTGEMIEYIRTTDGTIRYEWDAQWDVRRDDEYELTLTCAALDAYGIPITCAEIASEGLSTRFVLYCETNADGDELDCADEAANRSTWRLD